jgi:curved DNA-binding protein CbpA
LRPREVGADAALAAGIAHQGSLAAESALHLFALAAAVKATGCLTLGGDHGTFGLTFRRGAVEHASSSDPDDELGRFLVRKGALRAEALARAEAARTARGGDLPSTLIAERLVNPADVAGLLQEHGARLVHRALAVEAGSWSWDPQASPPPGAFPLGAPFAMVCAAVRALDASALMRRLGDREQRAASRIGGRIRVEDLRLTPQETRVAGLFDGARSPAEIAAAIPADAVVVLRLALLLAEVQLLAFGAVTKAQPAAPAPSAAAAKAPAPSAAAAKAAAPGPAAKAAVTPAAPKPAVAVAVPPGSKPVPPAARPAAPAAPSPRPSPPAGAGAEGAKPAAPKPALDRAAVEALLAKTAGADHFAVLGVKQEATGAQIKSAYFQLAKAYHPDAVPTDAPADVKKLCADLFARVSEAWSVLGDDAPRAAYLEKLRTGGTAEVDVGNIFRAESVFEAGTLLVKARKYDEAIRKFDDAMKLNPDEAEFGMWKAWCEFLLADDPRAKLGSAASAIEAGLRRNPRCAQGYLFLGQMAKLAGDAALAEKQLRRGLEVAPEHGELQRELKYLKKK